MFDRWRTGPFKGSDQNPVLWTFAHNPQLADSFSALNIHLLSTTSLPLRERQIAIMRTAWICDARYMWSSHLRTSLRRGLEPELFGALQVGASDPYFTTVLAAQWSNKQLLDFMFTVGTYVCIAGVMRSTGVQREEELLELAERYGAPR